MRKLLFLSLCLLSCAVLSSCDKDKDVHPDFSFRISSADDVTTTPMVLEAIGGKVPVTILLAFPREFMLLKMKVTVTPVLVSQGGGEARGTSYSYQGSWVEGSDGQVISYTEGGTVMIKSSFDYIPAMAKSELYLEFDILYQGQHTIFRTGKIADGTISTY